MSAHIESVVVASRDAHPHGSAAATHSTVAAAAAASPAAAAFSSSSSPLPSVEHELAAVKQQLAALQPKIDATEKRRDARSEDHPLWIRADDELKQLREKETLLLKEKEQLRDEAKEIRAALRHQSGTFMEHGTTATQVRHRIETMLTAYLMCACDSLQWTSSPTVSQVFD